jgi:pilus assembly protein CpaE
MSFEPLQPVSPGQVHCVFGVKGGAGATTISTNLAVEIHQITGEPVLLLDLDLPLGDSSFHFGLEPQFTTEDVMENLTRMDGTLLASLVAAHPTGVDVLGVPYHPRNGSGLRGDQVRLVIEVLRRFYPFVVVDAPRLFSPGTLEAVTAADHIYLVTTSDTPAIRNLCRTLPVLETLTPGEVRARCRLLLNRYRRGQLLGPGDIEEVVGLPVFSTLRDDEVGARRALEVPQPAVLERTNGLGRDMHGLALLVTGGNREIPQRRWGNGFWGAARRARVRS